MTNFEQLVLDSIRGVDGWCSDAKAIELANLVREYKPGLIVEIGVFAGKSLIPMAMACRENGRGGVIGIDPWSQEESIKGQPPEHVAFWGKLDHEAIFKVCINNLTRLQLQDWVAIHRTTADAFTPPENIGILSVDGNHGPQCLADVIRYAPKVVQGGYVICDDLSWSGDNVGKSILVLQGMGFTWVKKVKNEVDDWAILRKSR